MHTILLLSLLTGSPEVTIVDEHRKDGDPTEVRISVINKADSTINISFEPKWHLFWFQFRLYDEQGRAVKLLPAYDPRLLKAEGDRIRIKPGETVTGYLSPKVDYQIPPGRYQVEVDYHPGLPIRDGKPGGCVSNRITMVFP